GVADADQALTIGWKLVSRRFSSNSAIWDIGSSATVKEGEQVKNVFSYFLPEVDRRENPNRPIAGVELVRLW
ncbi:hypothetical protein, partial [Pseudomonas sp. GW456-12-10-14-LB2]|uniref:hypothetical protein n=1 Tax=Pseudomonas sp. GW456-12-10-14-LB2 TaxID=2070674 RepID=UPI001C470CF2